MDLKVLLPSERGHMEGMKGGSQVGCQRYLVKGRTEGLNCFSKAKVRGRSSSIASRV